GEVRGGQLALRTVEVDEAVDEGLAHVPGDALLARQRTGCRLRSEGGPGRGPSGIPVLESLQKGAGGRLVARGPVGCERRAVEVPDEVLGARAAGDPARVEADDHDPLEVVRITVDRQREQVWALPGTTSGVAGAELGKLGPL